MISSPRVVGHEPAVAVADEVGGRPSVLGVHAVALPQPLAGRGVDASQLAVAADAVEVVAGDDRRRENRVQGIGLIRQLAAVAPPPQHPRRRPVRVEGQHHRAVEELADHEVAPAAHRRGDRQSAPALEGLLPVDVAGRGVERGDRRRVPDDQLPRAPCVDHDRRCVAGLGRVLKGPPHFFAGGLVEGGDLRVGLAPEHHDEQIALDERRLRHAEDGHRNAVLGRGVDAPDEVAGRGVEARQHARRPEDVDALPVHRGRRPRARRELEVDVAVGGRPLSRPQPLARLLVENHEPLVPVHGAAARGLRVVEDVDAPAGHRRPREAAAHGDPPFHRQAVVGEPLDESGVAPHRVAVDAAPLRPVLGAERDRGQADDQGEHGGLGGHGRIMPLSARERQPPRCPRKRHGAVSGQLRPAAGARARRQPVGQVSCRL